MKAKRLIFGKRIALLTTSLLINAQRRDSSTFASMASASTSFDLAHGGSSAQEGSTATQRVLPVPATVLSPG